MCWFFNWSQHSTGRSPIPTADSRGYLHLTQWWQLFCQARPHRALFTSRGFCSLQRTADNKHTLRFISIHTVTLWNKNSPRYIPADHGHYVNWSRGCSCIPRWHHCCWSIKTGFDRTDQQSSDTPSRFWVPASTWKVSFLLTDN